MKDVLISIRPEWVEKIASGEKTIEVRKTKPKLETPFKCYIYQTKSKDNAIYKQYDVDDIRSGKVIGEFICDRIDNYYYSFRWSATGYLISREELKQTGLSFREFQNYGTNGNTLYGWHISDLKIYDRPRELSEFSRLCKYAQYQEDEWYVDWFCGAYECDCKYADCPSCGGENYDHEDYAFCLCEGKKPLTRQPQSWCYVKEMVDA